MNEIAALNDRILSVADERVRQIADDTAKRLKSYIQYEYIISNMELASSWKRHGYDFKMMPQEFIEHIHITPVAKHGNRYSLDVAIEAESFKEEDESKIEFFKKYVLGNALSKIKTTVGGDIR